jgi:hypothetical protein
MNFTENPVELNRNSGTIKILSFFISMGALYAGFLLFVASSPDLLKTSMSSKVIENPTDMIPELQMHSSKHSPKGPVSKKFVKSKDYRIRGEIHKVIDTSDYTDKRSDSVFVLCKDGDMILEGKSDHLPYYWVKVSKAKMNVTKLVQGKVLEVIHSGAIESKLQKRDLRFFFAPKSTYLARNVVR